MVSEFGKGLCYNLGLFLAHEQKYFCEKERLSGKKGFQDKLFLNLVHKWFDGAADHFYDFQVDQAPKNLQNRLRKFQDKCLTWRNASKKEELPTEESVLWALQEAKDLLRLIDKASGISTERGQFE